MRKMGWIVAIAAQAMAVSPAFAETVASTTTVVTEHDTLQVEKFGNAGQWAPNAELNISNTGNGQVSGLYFVGENVALGLGLGGGYSNANNSFERRAQISVAPKVAVNLEINDKVSFMPQLSLAYSFNWARDEVAPAVTGTQYRNGLTAELFVPLMAHVGNRFFIGLGPQASLDVVGRNTVSGNGPVAAGFQPDLALQGNFASRNFSVGVRSIVGAWL